jgi:hypothetical protein
MNKILMTRILRSICMMLMIGPMWAGAQDLSMEELKSNFENPGATWRGKPFWSWNGKLEKEELIRQIHVMKERSNDLTLEVVLTRRNAFGPLHHTPFNTTTGPGHFTTQGDRFSMNYILYPSGIMEPPSLKLFK